VGGAKKVVDPRLCTAKLGGTTPGQRERERERDRDRERERERERESICVCERGRERVSECV